MKKVWIASILTCIILMLPLTNVVSANEVEDCVECQPMNRVELLKVKLLLIRIEAITNIISSKLGHITEIAEKCEEISEGITTFREKIDNSKVRTLDWDFPIFCKFLENWINRFYEITDVFLNMIEYLMDILPKFEYPIYQILMLFCYLRDYLMLPFCILGAIFCGWVGPDYS